MTLHPVLERAAGGDLPGWARMGPDRRAHAERVADLLGAWSDRWALGDAEGARWRAAGMLHDALRDEDPGRLESPVDPSFADLPGTLLHGPAAAARLRDEGVRDEGLLRAIAWHSTGHPDLGRLGRALYLADFLEPGRDFRPGWRAALRERVPGDPGGVLAEVVAARIGHLEERGWPVRPETLALRRSLEAA